MRKPSTAGFTMIEVMIAVTILSIAAFALFSAMGTSTKLSQFTQERSRVMQEMENLIEEIQSITLEQVAEDYHGTARSVWDSASPAGAQEAILISAISIDTGRLTEVTLRAEWTGQSGLQSEQLIIYLTNRGG